MRHSRVLSAIALLAVAPLAPAQFVEQGLPLVGADHVGYSAQGSGAALSADGNTAIIGAFNDDNPTNVPGGGKGCAFVFTRSGAVWTQQGPKLVGSGAVDSARQGSVELSADGNTALIAGASDDSGRGAVWTFVRNGGVWTQLGSKLSPPALPRDHFGREIGLSADGRTAVVASNSEVFVFVRSGAAWSQQVKLTAEDVGGDASESFGHGVALSGDGNTLAVGALWHDGAGAFWVFTRTGGQWRQQGGKLVGSGRSDRAQFGERLRLSSDGNTLIVAGQADLNLGRSGIGAVWFFTRTAGVWTQQGPKVQPADPSTTAGVFATSLAISGDGNTAVVGSTYLGIFSLGDLRILRRTAGIWKQVGPAFAGSSPSRGYSMHGYSIAISADGSTMIEGNPFHASVPNFGVGSAVIFGLTRLELAGPPAAIAGQPVDLQIRAVDANGNLAAGLEGGLSLSSSDPRAQLPQNVVLSRGAGSFQATFQGIGSHTVTAAYTAFADVKGTSGSLLIRAPKLLVSPSQLSLRAVEGAAATGSLTASADAAVPFSAISSSAWLSVAPSSGFTPATVTVGANPAGLQAGAYSASITFSFGDGTSSVVPVAFVLSPALPLSAIANGASFAVGAAAPNTLLSAFGNFAACPSTATVEIDGAPVAVFGSSSTQINFLAPESLAGKAIADVRVTCAGTVSRSFPLPVVPASPAVFTAGQTGTGQAAVVNQNGGLAGPSPRGTVVSLFGTGFGLLAPRGADGLARTLLPVAATVGGVSTPVLYTGESPGFTTGLQQINIFLPNDAPSGDAIVLQITVGGIPIQAGVTLSIQ